MVTKASILIHYKQGIKIIVETNFSDYVSNRVFFQLREDKLLYIIAFFYKNLSFAKYNYKIYDKELLTIL